MSKNSTIYFAISEAIRKDIARRRLKPHSRLPSELELARKYGTARATVRRALAQLQGEGLIYSRQAVGSFVAEPRVEQDLDQLFSFTQVMVDHHILPASRLLACERQRITAPDSPILARLGLKSGVPVIHVRRLRLGSGEPLVIATTWLPEARFPDFFSYNLEEESVYEIMGKCGYRPTDAVQTFQAVTLDCEQAQLLTVEPGSPALLIRRTGYSNGLAVEYAVDYYRGDRTTFRARLGLIEQRHGPPRDEHLF